MQERIADYLNFGVRYVWLIDPRNGLTFVHTPDAIQEVKNGILSTKNPDINVSLSELE
jgi:Uma2 family endonuclease